MLIATLTGLLTPVILAMTGSQAMPTNPTSPLPVRSIARAAARMAADSDYYRRGLEAQASGDLEAARRAYVVAVALERDAGLPGTEPAYALAHVLYLQARLREAATVLSELASTAAARHDDDTEARALMDARYLNTLAHRPSNAQANGERLSELLKSDRLAPSTRQRLVRR